MISRRFNTYLFRHFTPYFEHFQLIHLSFSAPISKTWFFSLTYLQRTWKFHANNKYTDTSVQEGNIPGFSNYFEHTREMTKLLHEAIINHKDLTVVWLDLANAYGYIPHQLIQVTMHQYYIQDRVSNLFINYFNNIHIRFSSNRFTTTIF